MFFSHVIHGCEVLCGQKWLHSTQANVPSITDAPRYSSTGLMNYISFFSASSYLLKMISLCGNASSEFHHPDNTTVYPVKLSIVPFPKLAMTNEGDSNELWLLLGVLEELNILYLLWSLSSLRYLREASSMQTTYSLPPTSFKGCL